jgi:ADP-heptose:LPS heptosyltransferase
VAAVAPPRLVVLRALGLGDLLTAVPALRGLARAYPRHRRVLAAPGALGPLLPLVGSVGAHVAVGELEPLPAGCRDAEVGVNLHGSGPHSHRVLLAAAPRRMIGFACPEVPESAGSPAWDPGEHDRARWCRLLADSGIPADPDDLELPRPRRSPLARPGAVVLHPGAASEARRWPVERWGRVAAALRADGAEVLVTGGPGEEERATAVCRAGGLGHHGRMAGRTDLAALASIVAEAGVVVCGDTGVAHLATALGTPSVLLFGPTSPARWGPPPERPWHRVLWAGRTGDPHGAGPDPGLLEISVADVLEALAQPRGAALAG